MNWDAIAAIGELVGATAVLATLIYLAVQIRQNSRSIDQQNDVAAAEILQTRADSVTQLVALVANSEENVNVFAKLTTSNDVRPEDLDPSERIRASLLLTAIRSNFENTFLQYKQGFLPEEFYQDVAVRNCVTYGNALLAFNLPLSKSFREELERILERDAQPQQIRSDD